MTFYFWVNSPFNKSYAIYEYGSYIPSWIVSADAYLMSDVQVVTFNQWDAVSNSVGNNSIGFVHFSNDTKCISEQCFSDQVLAINSTDVCIISQPARIIARLPLVSEAGDTSFHYLFRLAEERAADKPGDCEGDYFIIVLPLFMCESAGCSNFCAALSLGPSWVSLSVF